MKTAKIIALGERRFYVYSFPEIADEAGNFELTLLTDSNYYMTSISADAERRFHIYNLSSEKQTIPTLLPVVSPIISGNGGTPYFLPLPWKLGAGTILRLINNDGLTSQVSIAGYRE